MLKTLSSLIIIQIIFYKNHINVLIIIITICISISLVNFLIRINYWIIIIIILIYIRGVMVLFIFVVSLAPNEKSIVKKDLIIIGILIIIILNKTPSENLLKNEYKIRSSYKINRIILILILLVIILSAYVPPKIIILHKGIKSSK